MGTFKSDPDDKKTKACSKKCKMRPRDPNPGEMVTAVMSTYFDGKKCRSLSWGGGAWRGSDGMKKCRKCCESRNYPITNKL